MVGIVVLLKLQNSEYLMSWLEMVEVFHCAPEFPEDIFLIPKAKTFIV